MLIKAAVPLTTSDTKTVSEWTRQMATLPQASKLATRILLLTLLFEVTTHALKVLALNFHSQRVILFFCHIPNDHLLFSALEGAETGVCQSGREQWDS